MLIRLKTKIGHIVKHVKRFKRIYRTVLNIFAKALKLKNYHEIITKMILEKQVVLEIANTSFNKSL